jgi:hypothetical protein
MFDELTTDNQGAAADVPAPSVPSEPEAAGGAVQPAENSAVAEPVTAPLEPIEPAAPAPASPVESEPVMPSKETLTSELPSSTQAEIKVPPVPTGCPNYQEQFHQFIMDNNAKSLRVQRVRMADRLEKIVVFARENGKVTNNDVERLTGVKDTRAVHYLNMLIKQNRLARFNENKSTFYKVIE